MSKTVFPSLQDVYAEYEKFKSDYADGRPMLVQPLGTERKHTAQGVTEQTHKCESGFVIKQGCHISDVLSLCDALDEHMYRMFEIWATNELREMFECEVKHLYEPNAFTLANDGEYASRETRVAFEVWKLAKGFE